MAGLPFSAVRRPHIYCSRVPRGSRASGAAPLSQQCRVARGDDGEEATAEQKTWQVMRSR